MSDIFQEVEEDIRRERMRKVWQRIGPYVIALAVLIVLVTAGYRGWEAWTTSREQAAGDAFAAAITEAEDALPATAAERLVAYAAEAPEGYAMLARFRAASALEAADDPQAAIALLRDLAEEAPTDLYRDLARVRLASVLLDTGAPSAAAQAVSAMAENSANPFHRSAQEMMGLAAYARNEMEEARRWFGALTAAADTPATLRQRAQLMISLLDQTTGAPADTEAADNGAAGQETN
jgi:hypothetical protein